ncbi:uncharacterized protein LOC115920392 [Strongylocentrotus purpuratus]|uniref:G-protein coupled receptors family 1 profile domain-containing protein n=1 Tax=Strongylocentrotus purpuratus TaxID=7668 RepID=A0A7M7N723_STRPU|nr:uncharacterized protein LOC115920392 [Strongylocentrotus purpuratus]
MALALVLAITLALVPVLFYMVITVALAPAPVLITSLDFEPFVVTTVALAPVLFITLGPGHSGPTGTPVAIFSLLMFLSVTTAVLNVLILIAFHIEKKLRTYPNQYILNMTISDLLVGFIMAIRKGNTSQTNFNISVIQGENASVIVVLQENATKPSTSIQSDHITVDTVEDVRQLGRTSTSGRDKLSSRRGFLRSLETGQATRGVIDRDRDELPSRWGFLRSLETGQATRSSVLNVLILIAFHIEKKLRTYTNQYILNITISDLLVGFVMAIRSTSLTIKVLTTIPSDGTRIDINASGVQNDDTVVNVHTQEGIIGFQQETDTKDSTSNEANSICSCRPSEDDLRREDPETLSQQLKSQSDPSQEISTRRLAEPPLAKDSRMKPSHLSSSNNNKVMRTLTLITLAFFLTWLPSSVAIIALDFKSKMPAGVTEFVRWASYSNSLINPITYAIAQPLVRQTIWRIVRCR